MEQREIKFRAWDKGYNKMIYKVNLYSINNTGLINKAQLDNQQVMRSVGFDCEIMQFTGHQINGVDIYEADVIRDEIDEDNGTLFEYFICVWIKEWSMFGFLHLHDEYETYLSQGIEGLDESMFWTFPVESTTDGIKRFLCGNIFEKPELLQYDLYETK